MFSSLKSSIESQTGCGKLIKKHHPETEEVINRYLNQKNSSQQTEDSFKVVHDIAKPFYSETKLLDEYKAFFDETEDLNKSYQMDRPGSHIKKMEVLQEIEN